MEQQTQRKVYTTKEAREILHVSRPTLNDWSAKGIIKKVQVKNARRVYYTADSVDRVCEGK